MSRRTNGVFYLFIFFSFTRFQHNDVSRLKLWELNAVIQSKFVRLDKEKLELSLDWSLQSFFQCHFQIFYLCLMSALELLYKVHLQTRKNYSLFSCMIKSLDLWITDLAAHKPTLFFFFKAQLRRGACCATEPTTSRRVRNSTDHIALTFFPCWYVTDFGPRTVGKMVSATLPPEEGSAGCCGISEMLWNLGYFFS